LGDLYNRFRYAQEQIGKKPCALIQFFKMIERNQQRIIELKILERKAISDLDFDGAESLEKQIFETIENGARSLIESYLSETKTDIDHVIKNYQEKKKELIVVGKECKKCSDYSIEEVNHGLYEIHLEEIKNLDLEEESLLKEELSKPFSEQIELFEKARNEALIGKFSEAKKLKETAKCVYEREIENRKSKIHNYIVEKKEASFQNYQNKKNDNIKNYETELSKTKDECQSDLDTLKKTTLSEINHIENIAYAKIKAIRCSKITSEEGIKKLKSLIQSCISKTSFESDYVDINPKNPIEPIRERTMSAKINKRAITANTGNRSHVSSSLLLSRKPRLFRFEK